MLLYKLLKSMVVRVIMRIGQMEMVHYLLENYLQC